MAKTETTVRGYVYTVTSPNGGTVTDAEGKLNKPVSPGDQVTVTAPSDSLTCDDDDAVICKANFKTPLLALRLLGQGENALPAGYTRLEFLESTGTQAIVLPVNKNDAKSWSTRTEVQITELPAQNTGAQEGCNPQYQWGLWGSVSGGTSVFMAANNASGNLSLGKVDESWSSWITLSFGYDEPSHRWGHWGLNSVEDDGSKGTPNVTEFVLFCVKSVGRFAYTQKARKKWLILKADSVTLYSLIPALTPAGEPCMFDTVTREPFRNAGSGQFVVGMTLSQVRALRLPAGGGKLTLSLPHEASIDRLAQAALERARANGWELTLRYAEADVPAGYRKLEFLESTGTQWIDTGITLSSESEVKCGVVFTSMESFNYVFGGMGQVWLNEGFYALCYNSQLRAGFATQQVIGGLPVVQYALYNVKLDKNEFNVNGTQVYAFEPDSSGFTEQPAPCTIFAYNRYSINPQICRICDFSISRAGEMQVDYVPCISPDGKLGMYNRVDGTVYENAGSGQFVAGLATVDDVRKLWLPETGGELTVSVPADTPDSAVEQLRKNNPNWQIAIQYRTENNEN